ncbi:MAG: DNA repair protein RecN [Verrucomicrobiaceae bacterium]
MLTLLKIRNLALVDHLVWELGGGLVGVTGETGAGKSVIVGALKLILGERAAKGLIRTGEDQCTVESIFELSETRLINEILEDAGLDECDGEVLIIRRTIGAKSNKQFVNNCAATLGVLKKLGSHLVDLHGPHDHQSLLSSERQIAMLDAYAGASDQMRAYREMWSKWRDAVEEYEEAKSQREVGEQEKELLKFQVEEIESADLKAGEEEELEERFRRTNNASRLMEIAGKASNLVSEQVSPGLEELLRAVHELAKIDPAMGDLSEEVESATTQMQELERSLADYLDDLDIDPQEGREVEERYNLLETIKRKYGPTIEDAIEHGAEARVRLESSENREGWLSSLKEAADAAGKGVRAAARKLTGKRKKAAPALAAEIRSHLVDLGFKQAEFEVQLIARDEPGGWGLESAEYLFGPNPGEPLKPLRQVASSGEISRVMLAVKNALADQDRTPLMVFDEIDANVGGEIARAVGEKMASLGQRHQVVSITHFPQVAAVAHQHFVVEKRVEGGRSISSLTEVSGEGRVDELVRMLGGGGDQAREMAKSLLS